MSTPHDLAPTGATLITPGYAPAIGGVEVHVQRLAEALDDSGVPVEVLAATRQRELVGKRRHDGIAVDYRPALGIASMSASPALLWKARGLRRSDALVHVHSYHALSGLAVALVGKRPVVFTPHYHGGGHTPLARVLHIPYRWIGRRIFRRADTVICVSDAERALVEADFPVTIGKTTVIPNGVDVAEISAAQPVSGQPPTVLFVGRLEAYKHVADLIAGFAQVTADAQLVIVGSGSAQEELTAAASGDARVRVLGSLPRAEVCAWLRTAHVVVSLSEHEAFGITALEGAAAGAHVLLSDIPAHREVADKYLRAHARLIDSRSPDVLASELTALLERPRPAATADIPDWAAVAADTARAYQRSTENTASTLRSAGGSRAGLVDRLWADHEISVVAGPIDLPSIADMRKAFVEFMTRHPAHPLACTLDASLRWRPVAPADRTAHADRVIVDADAPATGSLAELLEFASNESVPPELPFRFTCFGSIVHLRATHLLCDGAAGSVLVLALTRADAALLDGLAQRIRFAELLVAAGRGAVPNMAAWSRYAARLPRRHRALVDDSTGAVAAGERRAPGRVVIDAVVDDEAYAELVALRHRRFPDVSISTLMAAAMYRALQSEGVDVFGDGMYTLVDFRRYLSADRKFAFGNGAKSIFIDAPMDGPRALDAEIKRSITTARALPASVLGGVIALRAQRSTPPPRPAPRILAMSAMPHLPYLDHAMGVEWSAGTTPGVVGIGWGPGTGTIDVFSIRTGDRIELATTLDSGDADECRIRRAFAHMTSPSSLFREE